jgi:hypothetical protein
MTNQKKVILYFLLLVVTAAITYTAISFFRTEKKEGVLIAPAIETQ